MASAATNNFTRVGYHDALYKELWHACAGPLVSLPRAGERVYYFPQGHMEQLGDPVHGRFEQQKLSFSLPTKILCRVIHVERLANPESDEVYAQLLLLPEDQTEVTSLDPPLPEPEICLVKTCILSRSEFIVNINKYLEAQKHMFSTGTRFKMRFEGKQVLEQSFNGTIVGIEDVDSSSWPDSRWRCLKVQWDEPSLIMRPERVSPWELEPLVAITPPRTLSGQGKKRSRLSLLPSCTLDCDVWKFPVESAAFSYYELYSSPSSSTTSKTNSLGFSGHSSQASFSPNRLENVIGCPASAIDEDLGKVRNGQTVSSLDAESDQHSETLNVNESDIPSISHKPNNPFQISSHQECKQISKCIKVQMQGDITRSVDLTQLECHEDLLRELEKIFEIEGELRGSTKKWRVVYTDDEGDTMLVGDFPWHEFCSKVR